MSSRQIVVGDLHGCLAELHHLLAEVELTTADELILVGDLIDKGPDSVGVVNTLARLAQRQRVILVEGNHEERFLRWLHYGDTHPLQADRVVPVASYLRLRAELTTEAIRWLAERRLWYRLAVGDWIVVHAGLPPTLPQLPPEQPQLHTPSATERKRWYRLEHLRYLDENGQPVSLEQEQPHHRFWAEVYDGHLGTVIFGHQVWWQREQPFSFPHAVGIDLGCVHGGRLGAWIVDRLGRVEWRSVPALSAYAPLWESKGKKPKPMEA